MLSPADKARLKKDLAVLEEHLASCADSGVQKVIENWIEEAKKKLEDSERSAE